MRRSRPLRFILIAWHITAGAGWFALLAAQVIVPWQDLKIYLLETVTVAVVTGLWLALGSRIGLFRYWWVIGKLLGTVGLLVLGGLALRGHVVPYSRWVGLIVLWLLVWLSVARPGGRRLERRPGRSQITQ